MNNALTFLNTMSFLGFFFKNMLDDMEQLRVNMHVSMLAPF